MTQYVGAEQAMVDLWVQSRLSTVASELEAIDIGLSTRIYPDVAPGGADWPVIIFQCQDPPRDIRGVGTFSVMVDTLYLVKAIAQVDDYAPLAPVAKVLHSALTSAVGGAVGDGQVLTSVRQNQFSMVELDEGVQFRHLGGLYRIQAQG